MDSTDRRVREIVLGGIAGAYGYNPRMRASDPDAPCATCDHRFDGHTGEEWEGPCGAGGCSCAGFVPFSPDA